MTVRWYNIGSAITTAGSTKIAVTLPYLRCPITALSGGGSLSVLAGRASPVI
jgi:hypothetical protein